TWLSLPGCRRLSRLIKFMHKAGPGRTFFFWISSVPRSKKHYPSARPADTIAADGNQTVESVKMSTSEPRIYVIGVGSDGLAGLTARARDLLLDAELMFGSEQTLGLLPEVTAERMRIGPDLQAVIRTLETSLGRQRMVVVAGGDPLCYGIAR